MLKDNVGSSACECVYIWIIESVKLSNLTVK